VSFGSAKKCISMGPLAGPITTTEEHKWSVAWLNMNDFLEFEVEVQAATHKVWYKICSLNPTANLQRVRDSKFFLLGNKENK
jgi:hypothetical protein